jgi:hypothetical protein
VKKESNFPTYFLFFTNAEFLEVELRIIGAAGKSIVWKEREKERKGKEIKNPICHITPH